MNELALEKLYTSEFPETVRDQLRELLKHRRALNTLQTYDATWRKWQAWARSEGLTAFPVSPQDLTRYLVVLNAQGATKSTVAMFMTVQRLAHKGRLDDPTGHLVVQETLKAIKRKDKRPKKQAKILSLNKLQLCCDAVWMRTEPTNKISDAKRCFRDRALLAIGWSGALRASEIVALNWEDITQVDHGYEIQIRTSKTDQESTGHMIALPWFRNELSHVCPVRLLLEHGSERTEGTEGTGAIFRRIHYDGSSGPRLSRRAVSRIVSRAASLANLPGHYSAHSLRRGFATWAAGHGATDRDIMRHGRWRSRAVMDGYVQAGTLWTDNALVRLLG